jgi:ubiquinone/menaquinone biosynthesis C-methylase UbiE
MLSRRSRLLLLPAGLLSFLLIAASFAIFWSQRGPGFRKEVDRLASIMELRPGIAGAEIGAGNGRMAVHIAQHLGASGHLYATEIDADKLRAIRNAASAAGLTNITVIQAGEHSAGLPDDCCDIIFMRRVYHHITDAPNTNRTLYAALRPGGRLFIIDFISPRWMFFLRHGIPSDLLVGQVTAAGFTLERRIDGWSPIDYCLIFRKTGDATPVH